MKKGMTMDDYMKTLDAQRTRAEAFQKVLKHIDNELEWMCDKEVEQESYYEMYTDEEGNEKKRWHSAVYKTDENGKEILIEPTEGHYQYNEYTALKAVKEEILAII